MNKYLVRNELQGKIHSFRAQLVHENKCLLKICDILQGLYLRIALQYLRILQALDFAQLNELTKFLPFTD